MWTVIFLTCSLQTMHPSWGGKCKVYSTLHSHIRANSGMNLLLISPHVFLLFSQELKVPPVYKHPSLTSGNFTSARGSLVHTSISQWINSRPWQSAQHMHTPPSISKQDMQPMNPRKAGVTIRVAPKGMNCLLWIAHVILILT